jgi:hypothetical protein
MLFNVIIQNVFYISVSKVEKTAAEPGMSPGRVIQYYKKICLKTCMGIITIYFTISAQ